jgi:hypothetical protein
MKQLDKNWSQTDTSHRLLLFNCCDTLATEDSNISFPSSSVAKHHTGGKRGETNYTFQSIDGHQEPDWDAYEDLMEEYTAMAITSESTDDDGTMLGRSGRHQREITFSKKFCEPPCACCGDKDHPMLSPIRTPNGAPLNCNYVCPAAMCENWVEERDDKNVNRFQPCPKKFAAMCRHNVIKAHVALNDYEQRGSGQYRKVPDRSKFRMEVLHWCEVAPEDSHVTRNKGRKL